MSYNYSYIKSTFPNFQYTNVYDSKIYNDIVPQRKLNTNTTIGNIQYMPNSKYSHDNNNTINEINTIKLRKNDFVNFNTLESRQNVKTDNTISYQNGEFIPFDNYETPYKIIDQNNKNILSIQNDNTKVNQSSTHIFTKSLEPALETFQDNLKYYNKPLNNEKFDSNKIQDEINHTIYVKHVLECSICKDMVLKQLNIESDRLFKEEILEILSYIVFAFFILMLLDSK